MEVMLIVFHFHTSASSTLLTFFSNQASNMATKEQISSIFYLHDLALMDKLSFTIQDLYVSNIIKVGYNSPLLYW